MYLKASRTPFIALVMGIYLELSIRNGICDDSQFTSSYQEASVKGNNKTLPYRHGHSWKGWEDWLPSTATETQQNHNHDIPLSLSEQAKLRYRRNRNERKFGDKQQQQTQKSQSRSSKNNTQKTGKNNLQSEGDTIIDFKNLRDTAKTFATSLLNHFMTSWSTSSSSSHKSATSESSIPRNSRAVYLDNLGDRQDGFNHGKPERDAQRGVIDWLSRLIGVQGKTLGEFLREYQVHVLYDLAFTFFKWIFFLYAGLLIP